MGFYIEGPPHGKAQMLLDHGGTITDQPNFFSDVPQDYALIVIVNNGAFEAAALCYCEDEFKRFTNRNDPRPRGFILLDKKTAHKLAHYNQ